MNATITTKQVKELAVIRHDLESNKAELVLNEAVVDFLELKSSIEEELSATWKAIEGYMIDNNIKDVANLTIAERKSWKVAGELAPRFYKKTLDTSLLNFMASSGRPLPKNAKYSITKYMTKTNRKLVEA